MNEVQIIMWRGSTVQVKRVTGLCNRMSTAYITKPSKTPMADNASHHIVGCFTSESKQHTCIRYLPKAGDLLACMPHESHVMHIAATQIIKDINLIPAHVSKPAGALLDTKLSNYTSLDLCQHPRVHM